MICGEELAILGLTCVMNLTCSGTNTLEKKCNEVSGHPSPYIVPGS